MCSGLLWFGVVCGGLWWFAVIQRTDFPVLKFICIDLDADLYIV